MVPRGMGQMLAAVWSNISEQAEVVLMALLLVVIVGVSINCLRPELLFGGPAEDADPWPEGAVVTVTSEVHRRCEQVGKVVGYTDASKKAVRLRWPDGSASFHTATADLARRHEADWQAALEAVTEVVRAQAEQVVMWKSRDMPGLGLGRALRPTGQRMSGRGVWASSEADGGPHFLYHHAGGRPGGLWVIDTTLRTGTADVHEGAAYKWLAYTNASPGGLLPVGDTDWVVDTGFSAEGEGARGGGGRGRAGRTRSPAWTTGRLTLLVGEEAELGLRDMRIERRRRKHAAKTRSQEQEEGRAQEQRGATSADEPRSAGEGAGAGEGSPPPHKEGFPEACAPVLKLTYLDAPGTAEPIRLALFLAGLKFEDHRVSYAQVAAMRDDGTLPFGQVPVLEVDGVRHSHSQGLLRWAGRQSGLYPEECQLQCDTVEEALVDIRVQLRPQWYGSVMGRNPVTGEYLVPLTLEQKRAVARQLIWVVLPTRLGQLEHLLKQSQGPWFCGSRMTICDLSFHVMAKGLLDGSYVSGIPTSVLEEFPLLLQLSTTVGEVPRVRAWGDYHAPEG